MKTKEQVYQEVFPTTVEEVLYAMQLYSDQQNKELREENDGFKKVMTTLAQMIDSKNSTIEELKTFLKEAYATE